jgi:hypothetical protein
MWYIAFFGGYDMALMTINQWNEKMIEFYAWFIIIPLILIGFYFNFKEVFCCKSKLNIKEVKE